MQTSTRKSKIRVSTKIIRVHFQKGIPYNLYLPLLLGETVYPLGTPKQPVLSGCLVLDNPFFPVKNGNRPALSMDVSGSRQLPRKFHPKKKAMEKKTGKASGRLGVEPKIGGFNPQNGW